MLTIIAALKSELLPLFDFYLLQNRIKMAGGALYQTNDVNLFRCGIGKEAVQKSFDLYVNNISTKGVINIGLSGALADNYKSGDIFLINEIWGENKSVVFYPELMTIPGLSKAKLLTVEDAVFDSTKRDKLFEKYKAELVDMEAYYLAEICKRNNIPFYCVKIASDNANEQAKQQFMESYKKLAVQLTKKIYPFIESMK